jgi:hypothetical protein
MGTETNHTIAAIAQTIHPITAITLAIYAYVNVALAINTIAYSIVNSIYMRHISSLPLPANSD